MTIEYGLLLSDEERIAIDFKAYNKYFSESEFIEEEDDGFVCIIDDDKLSFNDWYGTEIHQIGINILMRKKKIEEINKKADI